MGSRLLPLALVAGALLADGAGAYQASYYLVLLAVPAAAAPAFLAVSDVMEGKDAWLRGIAAVTALGMLLLGAAARAHAPVGAAVPALAVSTLVAALAVYSLPLVGWLLEPLRPRRRASQRARVARASGETHAAHAEAA
jgi:HAMP domain-containing protein